MDQLSLTRKRHYANKPHRSIAHASHTVQHQPIVGLISGIRTGESRRVDAGRATQRIHLQARIVYKQIFTAIFRIIAGLLNRILFECRAGFFARRNFS